MQLHAQGNKRSTNSIMSQRVVIFRRNVQKMISIRTEQSHCQYYRTRYQKNNQSNDNLPQHLYASTNADLSVQCAQELVGKFFGRQNL